MKRWTCQRAMWIFWGRCNTKSKRDDVACFACGDRGGEKMKRTIKIIRSITLSVVSAFAVLMIEPVRFFAGMASAVIFVMLVVDAWRGYKKWKS